MIGHNYVVFSGNVAEWLKSLDLDGIRFEPTVIWKRKRQKEHSCYQEALISYHFSGENINDINTSGRRFLVMDNQYLFASPQLHEIIASEKPELFRTSEGLSRFG